MSKINNDFIDIDYIKNELKEVYYTNEAKTNKIWIDGKPIYRKVYYIASLPNATSQDYDPGISNMNYLVDMSGTIIFANGFMPVNTPRPDSNGSGVAFYWQNNKIHVISPSDRSNWSCYVILEYTKTNN